jgi:hypothetical protein
MCRCSWLQEDTARTGEADKTITIANTNTITKQSDGRR